MRKAQRLSLLLWLFLLPGLPAAAPTPQRPQSPSPPPVMDREDRENREPEEVRLEHEMQKKQNKARQEALKRDTDKLVHLANELKGYVDKTNENLLSLEVVRKAEEIEKLAHSVREKMRGQ